MPSSQQDNSDYSTSGSTRSVSSRIQQTTKPPKSQTWARYSATILAARAKTCNEGFLQDRQPPQFPLSLPEGPLKTQDPITHYYHNLPPLAPTYSSIPLPFLCEDDTIGTIHLQEQAPTRQLDPLYARAWAMQEIMLSPRHLLYSTTQLHYKCRGAFHPSTTYTNWQTYSRSSSLKLSQITLDQPNAFEPHTGP
jgi:hypothetical protein